MQFLDFPLGERLGFVESSMLAYRMLTVQSGPQLPAGLAYTDGLVNREEWHELLNALNPELPDRITAPRGESIPASPFTYGYLLYCFCQLDGRPEAEKRVLPHLEKVKLDAAKWAYEAWGAPK
jgi:hypothetical protein